ncbi:hypothetical protein [Acidovorax sp. sic0104]|uniref:hypothetical protein n=1 Tax=Acidovorax sp. sic0104 TaxID=2854784 RepID=UPI001C46E2AA|nr:hypothetical protein [Acidovorax sp. sic0104]MBV7541944.1 hypothetical protein [Acidovorax sp. sic0104]
MAIAPTPHSILAQALQALELARERGDEHQATFAQAHMGLRSAVEEIVQYDGNLDWREISPTGDDYNWLLQRLGFHGA